MWITNNTSGPFRTPTFVPQFHDKGQICQILQGLRKKLKKIRMNKGFGPATATLAK
ncbi:hypothetical protein [Fournierella sp.]|uniref:hypothetical protein n=1 Tax=Allofournierella sp. TaxID=1940256 RepID=UPI003079657A